MKRMIVFLLPMLLLMACNNKTTNTEIDNLTAENERLRSESIAKDSTMNALFASYNEIEENLALIKEKERLIRKEGTGDLSMDAKSRITTDLTMIAELMEKNKQTIASLRKRIKDSEVRMVEFEKTIELLTKTIEDKDVEIIALTNQLATKDAELETLAGQIQSISSDLETKSEKIMKQDAELNTAYYVMGTEQELRENGIITREGGFVGIGKTRALSKDFNTKYFKEIDIRKVTNIPINARSAKVITVHPTNSYSLIGDKTIERIEILDYKNFWRTTKHLVIIVRQ